MSAPLCRVSHLDPAVRPRFPAIYPLEPRGFGGGGLECLTSHITALARRHSMLTAVFMREALQPAMRPAFSVGRKAINSDIYATDGYGRIAERLAAAGRTLTGRDDWRFLTLLPWRGLFSHTGSALLEAAYRRWCPVCWREDLALGIEPYGRLAWTIGTVDVCVAHGVRLQHTCPHCGAIQPAVPSVPFLDLCGRCGGDLKAGRAYRLKSTGHARILWFARAVDRLIARTCASRVVPPARALSDRLREYIERHADGRPAAFARQIRFGVDQMRLWCRRRTRPGFALFLELCYRLDCPPDEFLLEPMELLSGVNWRPLRRAPRYVDRHGRSREEIRRIEQHLNRLVRANPTPPPRILDVARELGVRYCYLRLRFPLQYRAIQQRSERWRLRAARARAADRMRRLRTGMRTLLRQGIFPSDRHLRRYGYLKASDLRRPEVRAARKALLQEFRLKALGRKDG